MERARRQSCESRIGFRVPPESAKRADPRGHSLLCQRSARELALVLVENTQRTLVAAGVELRFGAREDCHLFREAIGGAAR